MRTLLVVLLLILSGLMMSQEASASECLVVSPDYGYGCGHATVPVPATIWLIAAGAIYLIRRK